MNVTDTFLEGVKIIEPVVFGDERGYFFESWNEKKFAAAGINCKWLQDNESKSRSGVLRGLHFQAPPYTQAKLIRVIQGSVLDVVVDIRKDSPTFGRHFAAEISSSNKKMLFIPRGFAHGFAVLSEEVIFSYKCDNPYMPSHERGIAFDDPDLKIDWQIPAENVLLSAKDTRLPRLKDAELFVTEEYPK